MEDASSELQQPQAVKPIYFTPNDNEQIVLYDDVMEVKTIHGISSRQGKLFFVWQPRAAVHIEAKLDFNIALMPWDEFKASFRLPSDSTFTDIEVEVAGTEHSFNQGSYGYVLGSSGGMTRGAPAAIHKIVFHVPNFTSFAGTMVWHEREGSFTGSMSRATIQHPDWHIILDGVGGYDYYRQGALERTSGNAITHVGEITRLNNPGFTAAEATHVLQRLAQWLSFTRGNWTAPILSSGFAQDGSSVWDDWRCPKIEPCLPVISWADPNKLECFELGFSGFCQRCDSHGWSEPIGLAITWYVECCRQASGVEAAIMLIQTGLELLGWTYLIDEKRRWSANKFYKFAGPDKLRHLLDQCGIPIGIPAQLSNLRSFAGQHTWPNGPTCLVYIRNLLIHSRNQEHQFPARIPDAVMQEVWTLGIWYFELVLLKLFNYSGVYSNRLNQPNRRQPSTEPVPWMQSGATPA
jgi:hypothetical protein